MTPNPCNPLKDLAPPLPTQSGIHSNVASRPQLCTTRPPTTTLLPKAMFALTFHPNPSAAIDSAGNSLRAFSRVFLLLSQFLLLLLRPFQTTRCLSFASLVPAPFLTYLLSQGNSSSSVALNAIHRLSIYTSCLDLYLEL